MKWVTWSLVINQFVTRHSHSAQEIIITICVGAVLGVDQLAIRQTMSVEQSAIENKLLYIVITQNNVSAML